MGEFEAHNKYSSNLIPNSVTTHWTIHDVDKIAESCCWTCMSIDVEVPLGATSISKWKISLCVENNVLHGRSKLITPNNKDVTHKVNFTILKNGEKVDTVSCDSDKIDKRNPNANCAKETSSRSKQPSMWKIMCLNTNELSDVLSDDNTFELFVETIVYGSYTASER